jgi:phosphate/sulfate permease
MQEQYDPHHMHPDFSYYYYFLILAPILAIVVTYSLIRLLTYLENRKNRRAEKNPEKQDRENQTGDR